MTAAADIDAFSEGKTIPLVFLDMLGRNGPRVAFRWKASTENGDAWSEVTWDQFARDVARAAAGLSAQGLGRGDRLMLMLRNVYEFHVLDTAALFLGATPVSIYNSSSVEQVRYLASDAGATLAVVENDAFLRLFDAARPDLPLLTGVGVVSSAGDGVGADFTYADLMTAEPLDLSAAAAATDPDDLATLIYTSGTTGPSKGVMIDHRNVVWTGFRAFTVSGVVIWKSCGADHDEKLPLLAFDCTQTWNLPIPRSTVGMYDVPVGVAW